MRNRKLLIKIVLFAVVLLLLFSLAAPVIFSQAAPRKENLLNGLKVLTWNEARSDKVTVRIRIHSGSAFDPQGKEGLMQLLADNLFPNEAAREFFVEDLGGGLEVIANYDFIQVNASAKADQFLTMLETVAAAVANPPIDRETTPKLKAALTARIKEMEAVPGYVADQAAAARLLGTFPYGRPQLGTEASVAKIEYADLVEARQRFLTADNATITVSGNFDRALAMRAIRRYFGSWLKADRRVPATFRQPEPPPAGVLTIPSPKPDEAAIRVVARGVARSDKDLAASQILAFILEARLRARVPAERASSVSVRNDSHLLPGVMFIRFAIPRGSSPDAGGRMEAADLLTKTLTDNVSEAEVQAARVELANKWKARDIEDFWLDNDTYRTTSVDADRNVFDAVTLTDVRAFAEKLRSAPTVTVLVNTPA